MILVLLNQSLLKYSEMYWINNKVGTNIEQQKAILNILDKTALPSPYIIFGPPGTGKTATLVETICQV